MLTREEFGKVIDVCLKYYDKVTFSEAKMELYWQSLAKFSANLLQTAVLEYVNLPKKKGNYETFPLISELVALITGDLDVRAIEAWAEVKSAMRYGSSRRLCFDEPAKNKAVVSMGTGWQELCMRDRDTLDFKQKEFAEAYKTFVASPPASYPKWIGGQKGEILFIGKRQEAEKVYQLGVGADSELESISPSHVLNKLIGEVAKKQSVSGGRI